MLRTYIRLFFCTSTHYPVPIFGLEALVLFTFGSSHKMRQNPGILLAIAGIANAVPHPQFNLPFSLPSFSLPTGSPGSGSGVLSDILAKLPSATGPPEIGSGSSPSWADLFSGGFGSGLSDLLSGGRSGAGNGPANPSETTLIQVTATPTRAEETAAPTRSTENAPSSSGTIGSDCSPQGSSGGRGGTENGVLDKNCCTDMTVIFARGTGEFGNVGTVSGPPMFKAIRAKLGAGRVTVQGVDYPASSAVSHLLRKMIEMTLMFVLGKRQYGR